MLSPYSVHVTCVFYRVGFQYFIYSFFISLLRAFFATTPLLLAASTTFLSFSNAVKGLFQGLPGNSPEEVLRDGRETTGEKRGRRVEGLRWTVCLPKGLRLPRRHREGFCLCVCGPMCLSRQQRTSLPHLTSMLRFCCQG